jgi:hypothetical protein
MAFKDSGEDDGKKSKKTKKSKGSRNGRGSLVLVLVVLWLIGLTAAVAFFNSPVGPGPSPSNLESRVSALEQRAGQVRGAIAPPGADDLGTLTDRVNQLEQRIGGGDGAAAANADGSAAAAGAMAGDCPCDRILARLDRLESTTTAGAGDDNGGAATATASADNGTAQARSEAAASDSGDESAEAPRARSASSNVARKSVRPGTRKPRPPQDIPGVEIRSFGRDGRPLAPVVSSRPAERSGGAMGGTSRTQPRSMPAPRLSAAPPVYSRDGNLEENLQQSTQTESVYDITRRMAPMYGYTEGEMRRMEQLAPGAAIYPGNNGGYVGSVLSN